MRRATGFPVNLYIFQMPATRPSRLLVVLCFAAVYILWGSTYLGIRLAIETLPGFLMAGTRFTLAGVILLTWSRLKGERFVSSWSQWRKALIVGALLLLCGNGGVTWAEKYVATGLAALLVSTEPLWVVILNWIITRKRPNSKVLLGILIGLAGVTMLVSDGLLRGNVNSSWLSLVGGGVVILAALGWAAGSVYSNRHPIGVSTSMSSGMQMFSGGCLLLIFALFWGDAGRLNLANASWTSIGAFFYLLVFGSLVGFTAYSWLLNNVTPAMATTYAYVNPVVAVFLGWLIAGEPLTRRMLIAAAVIISSVVLITTFSQEPKPAIHDSQCPTPPCA
ncbi:MAG TPA: EamA family transporter [Pyrinomonadaceae bacterium]|nr:EamA family transporter [Pyrinomonadaceae bacterium]